MQREEFGLMKPKLKFVKKAGWKIVRADIGHKLILEKRKEIKRIEKSIKRIQEWIKEGFWKI